MIDSLSQHGIVPADMAHSLITTHTIPNPGYVPGQEGSKVGSEEGPAEGPSEGAAGEGSAEDAAPASAAAPSEEASAGTHPAETDDTPSQSNSTGTEPIVPTLTDPNSKAQRVDHTGLGTHALDTAGTPAPTAQPTLDGVSTEISSDSKTITLDIRWTVLCDLFLVLTADSVYDARSRVLLERVAEALGLTWLDLTKFEKRVTDALEIEEDIQTLEDKRVPAQREASSQKKRLVMMGLATVGGGLVIGLSAGLLAPVIGAGIGAAFGAVGISGTSAFLGGVGGAAAITTTGTLGGAALGGRGMSRRTRNVKTFEFRPMHNHKRVNCIVTVPGFLRGPEDDPTLPYSVIDPVMGDAFSIMWEPEMMREMGNAMSILWNETLVQGVQQVLAATVAGAMFSALAWPLWLTKLNYIIDNPWSNATERARAAGLILADVLANRQLGVRPVTLVGFSLGARMIFYALRELARKKAFGIVQNVYLMGAPVSASEADWKQVRTVVSGRFVNGVDTYAAYSRSDWLLAYLHRATSGGLHSIAGLYPITFDCNIENVDVTQIVPGHLSYRTLTPLVLGEMGFKTTADYFDEPESLEHVPEREVIFEMPSAVPAPKTKMAGFKNMFTRKSAKEDPTSAALREAVKMTTGDDDLPPVEPHEATEEQRVHPGQDGVTRPASPSKQQRPPSPRSPKRAGGLFTLPRIGSPSKKAAGLPFEPPGAASEQLAQSVQDLSVSPPTSDRDADKIPPAPSSPQETAPAPPATHDTAPASPTWAAENPWD